MENMEKNPKLALIFRKYNIAKEIVIEAGERLKLMKVKSVEEKEDFRDLVTNCDKECQNFILQELKERYPEDSWLSEENVKEIKSSNLWILDPIDGTTNFIMTQKDYAISLAYMHEGVPAFGLVYDVEASELYHSIQGQGAYKNNERLEVCSERKMSESILDASLKTLVAFDQIHKLDLKSLSKKIRAHRSLGCSSLSICKIAEGKKQLFCSNHVKIWDYAAAKILLDEVGGKIELLTSLSEIDKNQTCIVASSSDLLEEFKKEITRWN